MAKIAPSILSADFAALGRDVKEICDLGADYIHVDVMDGMFVPNISFGAPVMKSLNPIATVPYDVHLMIADPDRYLEDFVTENTKFITVHQAACLHLNRTLQHIHSLGMKAGVSLNPGTSPDILEYVLPYLDMVLVMSVNPGFGGQKFIPSTVRKIQQLRDMMNERKLDFDIEVDGGINPSTAKEVIAAGANVLVAGSAVFGSDNLAAAITSLRG